MTSQTNIAETSKKQYDKTTHKLDALGRIVKKKREKYTRIAGGPPSYKELDERIRHWLLEIPANKVMRKIEIRKILGISDSYLSNILDALVIDRKIAKIKRGYYLKVEA